VEGGILPPGKRVEIRKTLEYFQKRLAFREVFSAGLGSPALRQARMPVATAQPKQLRDLHIELKVAKKE
jgi:hypothetical protein